MQPDESNLPPGKTRAIKRQDVRRLLHDRLRQLEEDLADKSRQCEVMSASIEELTRACDKLTETDRLKDELISIASHELKSPLTSIKGYAELVRNAARTQESCAACLRNISVVEAQVRKITNLVNKLLDSSRIRGGRFVLNRRRTDLIELTATAVEQSRVTSVLHDITLETDLTKLVGEWDPERIEQVLNNLLDNAMKYSPMGGQVRVRVRAENNLAHVSVSDQGIGVPQEDIPHLFGVYTRASNALESGIIGLGIGLYVSNQIICQHGGRMWLESQVGQGSTFHFELPL